MKPWRWGGREARLCLSATWDPVRSQPSRECVFFYAWMSGVADAAGGGRLVRFLWPCVIVCAARVCGIPIVVSRRLRERARPTAVTSIALILFSIIFISCE